MIQKKSKTIGVMLLLTILVALSVFTVTFTRTFGENTIFKSSKGAQSDSIAVKPMDLFENVRDAVIANNVDTADFALKDNGVRITNNGTGATVKYKNVIDISNNTKEDVLVKLFISPKTKGTVDFKKIIVKLTDAENPNNFIEVSVHQSRWWYHSTFYQVAAPNISGRAYRWGLPDDPDNAIVGDESGTELYGSFSGVEDYIADGLHRPFVISYDNAEKSVHAFAPGGGIRTILKLADPYCVGAGNEWGGFTSGRVNVSITASDFASSSADYIITVFDGVSMSGETITDEKAPALKVDAEFMDVMPKAVVNQKYPLFNAVSDDGVDGVIENISVQLTDPNGTKTDLSENYFVPKATGNHILTYKAVDKAGNITQKSFNVTAVMALEPLSLITDDVINDTAQVGSRITIPSAVVSGGSGIFTLTRTVKKATDNQECPIKDNIFIPEISGKYVVVYTVTDYLGTSRDFTYYIDAKRGEAPICVFPELPKTIVSGKTINLPDPEAYDYISNPVQVTTPVIEIYAKYSGGEYEKIDNLFVPNAEKGASVDIKYRVYCTGYESAALEKTYSDIAIIQPKQISDYFVKTDVDVVFNKNHIEFNPTKSGAKMEFVNPLSAENFELQFNIPAAKNKFDSITVTLTDTLSPAQKLTFEIKRVKDSAKSDVYFNGERYEMTGSFDGKSSSPFALIYKNSTRMVTDYQNINILRADKIGENNFYGFSSGRVYMSIEFNGVSGASAIYLQRIVDQSVYGDYNRQDELVDFTDRSQPLIETGFELGLDVERYQKINLPTAIAYDVIDPYVECFVGITLDGKDILAKTRAEDGGLSFYANEYGTYIVKYTAKDARGNLTEKEYRIRVTDRQPPSIHLLSELPTTVSVGQTIKVPNALTFDNHSEVTLMVFVVSPRQYAKDVSDNLEFKFEKSGIYTVRYYAYDKDNNYKILEFIVECKEK